MLLVLCVDDFTPDGGVVGGPDLGVGGAISPGLGVTGLIVFAPPCVVVCLTGGKAVVVVVVVVMLSQGHTGMLPIKRWIIFNTRI